MSDDITGRDRELQQALEAQAEELGLRRTEWPRERARMIGIAGAGTHSILEVERTEAPPPPGKHDEQEIAGIIQGFEALHPDEFLPHWEEYATDPYVAIGDELVGEVRRGSFADFLNSEAMKETMRLFPPFKPRKLEVHGLRIVFLGAARAAAVYRTEEEFRDGKTKLDNCCAILMRMPAGWRVTAVTTRDKMQAR